MVGRKLAGELCAALFMRGKVKECEQMFRLCIGNCITTRLALLEADRGGLGYLETNYHKQVIEVLFHFLPAVCSSQHNQSECAVCTLYQKQERH